MPIVRGMFKTSKRSRRILKCFNITTDTVYGPIRTMISPRLFDLGSLTKYDRGKEL